MSRFVAVGLAVALSSCGPSFGGSEPPPPSLSFTTSTLGPISGAYDGPAVVERSTASDLVLAFDPDPATGGTLPRHTTIQGVGPALLPVGARVWLKKDPSVEAVSTTEGAPRKPSLLSVRTAKDGTLLLGVASGSDASSITGTGLLPMQEKGKSSRAHTSACARGTLVTTAFAVQGDTTVVITDGETRVARVGGVDYDVGLAARSFDAATLNPSCADYGPYSWFQVSVRAHDLAALASALEVAQPPTCALGNAALEGVSIALFDVPSDVTYDGPVFYAKRGEQEGFDCFLFNTQGLTATAPGLPPPQVQACVPPGALAEPAAGEEFWATVQTAVATLRKANRGDLIAASILLESSAGTTSSAQIGDALGMPVDTHPGCDYADLNQTAGGTLTTYRLREVAFGAPPPVVVGSQAHAVVPIGGVDSDVWVWDSGAFSIVAR
jgi:hypothetical protein